jgi:hypothetical protein
VNDKKKPVNDNISRQGMIKSSLRMIISRQEMIKAA